jgi:hypothetical protein
MDLRVKKRIIIALVFVLILGAIGYGIYFINIDRPSCFDGIQNGNEDGVDCGLYSCGISCVPEFIPINILSEKLIKVSAEDYDFVAQVSNSNSNFGSSRVVYELNISDRGGNILLIRNGSFYILPGQTKYIIEPLLRFSGNNNIADLTIKSVDWEQLDSVDIVNFSLRAKNGATGQNSQSSQVTGIVFNNSDFDFDKVDVGVLLSNKDGEVNYVAQTNIRTLLSRTEREFLVSWPFVIDFDNIIINVEIGTNLFENYNFIRTYGDSQGQRFQEY